VSRNYLKQAKELGFTFTEHQGRGQDSDGCRRNDRVSYCRFRSDDSRRLERGRVNILSVTGQLDGRRWPEARVDLVGATYDRSPDKTTSSSPPPHANAPQDAPGSLPRAGQSFGLDKSDSAYNPIKIKVVPGSQLITPPEIFHIGELGDVVSAVLFINRKARDVLNDYIAQMNSAGYTGGGNPTEFVFGSDDVLTYGSYCPGGCGDFRAALVSTTNGAYLRLYVNNRT
jgi:hypothetical protein